MKNLKTTCISAVLILYTIVGIQAQNVTPSKKYITKELNNISHFNSISVVGSPNVEYHQSSDSQTAVSIYGPDNYADLIEVNSINGILQIRIKKGVSISNGGHILKVIASSPSLEKIDIIGSGDVYLAGTIKGNHLNLNITGSGDIEAEFLQYTSLTAFVKGSGDIHIKNTEATSVEAMICGSGDIEMKGSSIQAKLTVNGSGDIDTEELITKNVIATVSGSGDITCHASQKLDATVGGSGEIEYEGNPVIVNKKGRKNLISEK